MTFVPGSHKSEVSHACMVDGQESNAYICAWDGVVSPILELAIRRAATPMTATATTAA